MSISVLKLSVIIPTYNSERYLRRCLMSIRRQRYPNLEVIVVDGKSTDETAMIVAEFSDIITTFISEPDRGQTDAVTKGLKIATGDIFHWHASDDIVAPEAFFRVAAEFKAHPDVDLVFSDGWVIDDKGLYLTAPCRGLSFWDSFLFEGRFQSDSAYWRGAITEPGLPLDDSKALTSDEDFFLRIWALRRARWVNYRLGFFCVRPGQLSQTLGKSDLYEQRRDTRRRVASRLGITGKRLLYLRVIHCPHYITMKVLREAERATRKVLRWLTRDVDRRQAYKVFSSEWF